MTKKSNLKEYIVKVKNCVGEEYSVIGDYEKSSIKILMKHNVCGNEWLITPNNFLKGRRCPKCSHFKTTEQYAKEIIKLSNGNIQLIGEYKDISTPITLHCSEHNLTFTRLPSAPLRGNSTCPKCAATKIANTQKKSNSTFLAELDDRHNGTIKCKDTYVNTHTKLRFICSICGTSFITEPNAILRLSGCPTCATSKGEKYIAKYLKSKNINFVSQKRFHDCKYKRLLPFDFYLPEYAILIEYDGLQHTKPIAYFGGEKEYNLQVIKDNIKNDFAKNNNINLIHIPYTINESTIYSYLDKHIRK